MVLFIIKDLGGVEKILTIFNINHPNLLQILKYPNKISYKKNIHVKLNFNQLKQKHLKIFLIKPKNIFEFFLINILTIIL